MRFELLQLMLNLHGRICPVTVQVNVLSFLMRGQNIHLVFWQCLLLVLRRLVRELHLVGGAVSLLVMSDVELLAQMWCGGWGWKNLVMSDCLLSEGVGFPLSRRKSLVVLDFGLLLVVLFLQSARTRRFFMLVGLL